MASAAVPFAHFAASSHQAVGPQQRAFAYIDERAATGGSDVDDELVPWAFDASYGDLSRVVKTYGAASRRDFHAWYAARDARTRHAYELLRGATHAYLDLETPLDATSSSDVLADVRRLLAALCAALEQRYETRATLVLLDSSTPLKFSQHAVVRLDGVAFASPQACGDVIVSLVERWSSGTEPLGAAARLVDTAVYTSNRVLRIAGSSKLADAERTLKLAPAAWYGAELAERMPYNRRVVVDDDIPQLRQRYAGANAAFIAGATQLRYREWALDYETFCATLASYVPRTSGTRLIAAEPSARSRSRSTTPALPPTVAFHTCALARSSSAVPRPVASSSSTPPPLAITGAAGDDREPVGDTWRRYIEQLEFIRARGANVDWGSSKHMTKRCMFYVQTTSRHCEFAGREHASNRVAFALRMDTRQYTQRCKAPACARARACWRALPAAAADFVGAYRAHNPLLRADASIGAVLLNRRRRRRME